MSGLGQQRKSAEVVGMSGVGGRAEVDLFAWSAGRVSDAAGTGSPAGTYGRTARSLRFGSKIALLTRLHRPTESKREDEREPGDESSADCRRADGPFRGSTEQSRPIPSQIRGLECGQMPVNFSGKILAVC